MKFHHIYVNLITKYSQNISTDRTETLSHRSTPSCNILELCETALPKTSVSVQKCILFPLDAQVEMTFIIEIIPNFKHEHLLFSFSNVF